MHPAEFQAYWRVASENLKERTAAHSHFNALCALLGVQNPIEADPIGDTYTFEKGAKKAGGGDGWADVWYKGRFAWEYKGLGRDLDAAYLQLLRYKDALENPPLLVVCDLDRIIIRTNFTNTIQRVETVTLDDITDAGKRALLKRVWTDPDWFRPDRTSQDVTEDAARQFGEIARGLHARGVAPSRAAHFLMQLLFCLFAEDIGLLPNRIFSKMIDLGVRYPARFQAEAEPLLEAMNGGGFVAYERIPHVNGGPVLDPQKRSQLGAHYTGRDDIERVVDPVVMAPLRRR